MQLFRDGHVAHWSPRASSWGQWVLYARRDRCQCEEVGLDAHPHPLRQGDPWERRKILKV